jgi:hypothetical protein
VIDLYFLDLPGTLTLQPRDAIVGELLVALIDLEQRLYCCSCGCMGGGLLALLLDPHYLEPLSFCTPLIKLILTLD